jgi:DNA-binding Lrp family transcriptional regulator
MLVSSRDSNRDVERETGLSFPGARKLIEKLERAGIVAEISIGRNRMYFAGALVEITDESR